MNATTQTSTTTMTLTRSDLLLALLAAAEGAHYDPAQLQKSMFLLDRNLREQNLKGVALSDEGYNFQPFHYGPFDPQVYDDVEQLSRDGLAEIVVKVGDGTRLYFATDDGVAAGQQLLAEMPESCREYVRDVSEWTRSLDFYTLIASIYKAYPEMEENSIFRL